jgi:cyclase
MLVKGTKLVKGRGFSADRVVGHAAQAIRIQQARGVDELVMLDVTATAEGRGPDLALVEKLSEELRSPFAVGGGIRTVDDVRNVLRAGADKVVIGSACLEDPELLRTSGNCRGCRPSLRRRRRRGWHYVVDSHSGSIRGYTDPAVKLRLESGGLGAGEILLTSIDREGTMEGYDLELIRNVSTAVDIPVIAHGGCSGWPDMVRAIQAGASAVAAGALFQFTDLTPREAAKHLAAQGIEARV